jgi:hypothetical protein
MKSSIYLRHVGVAAVAATVLATGALAGARYGMPNVTITRNADGSGGAYGTLGGVRNSAFPGEKLSCTASRSVVLNAVGAEVKVTTVACVAIDKNGVSAVCTSNKEEVADLLIGVSNDSLIDFSFNAAGTCTNIAVYESSPLERKR